MKNATFLIKSSKVKSMGTGFCVATDAHGAFLVTCTHVVEECGDDSLEVNGEKVELLHKGSSDDIDLAVVYVKGLVDVEILPLSFELTERDTAVTLKGWKAHKKTNYIAESLTGIVVDVTEIQSNKRTFHSYKLRIGGEDSIEKGNSGSAVVCEKSGQVIAVATDRKSGGKQAYAIPISYLQDIWKDMPTHLLKEPTSEKSTFIHSVFEELDKRPMLLFSPESYYHTDYIEDMREEATELFGKPYLLEINCGSYHSIKDADKFFKRLSKRLGLGDEVEDSMDFEDVLVERFKQADTSKTFLLIVGFERLHEDVRNAFAETLRNLNEEYGGYFNLVIFGGEKLVKLKYSTGIHSYFNNFEQMMIPPFSFEEWKEIYPYLTRKIYEEIVLVTGGYAKLSEVCFKAKVKTQKEAEEHLSESLWSSELFRVYRKERDRLSILLSKEELGAFHPYCDDELLYKLYWDNLIVEQKGKFVWRSLFIVGMGREFFGV